MTVSAKLLAHHDDMTPSERQLLKALMDDYPIAGLSSITELASKAGVSTTTVARLLQKTGFDGFPQFQAALRGELKAMISGMLILLMTMMQSSSFKILQIMSFNVLET